MKTLWNAGRMLLFFTLLTGLIYPMFITAIARLVFPGEAGGSLVMKNGVAVGSELIGQATDSTIYFSSRPSAVGNNPLPSGGSNYGLTNRKLMQQVTERMDKFRSENGLDSSSRVPAEMVFASASGLDPHISVVAADLQLNRIVKARHFNQEQKKRLKQCIARNTSGPQFSIFGEERVNVLLLNMDLDNIK